MTNHETPSSPANAAVETQTSPRRSRRYLTVAAAVLAAGLTGAIATQAFSDPGFGPGGRRASLAVTYTLSYRIPVQTYIPKKIIKRKKQP